jgi:hypothetical protein
MSRSAVVLAVTLGAMPALGCSDGSVAPSAVATGADPLSADIRTAEEAERARPAGKAGPHVCVPFKTNGREGSVEIAGGPPPAPLEIALKAEGHATHLGHYSASASFVVTFPSPMVAVFDGGGTFRAADGDEVHFEFSGDFFPGPVAGGLGDYEIVGGTGRFEGATGSGVFSSEGGSTTFDGDICFAR